MLKKAYEFRVVVSEMRLKADPPMLQYIPDWPVETWNFISSLCTLLEPTIAVIQVYIIPII
jgi:hypothetical protein